jgi:nitric oxide dioxygenase
VTPDELRRVQRTFELAAADADRLATAFYDHLWGLAPEVRAMFPDDMAAQRQKLLDELAAIVAAVSDLDALVARTAPLGARHVEYGVEPDHYELVGEALVAALADVLGVRWDDETESAWRDAYDLVAETMLRASYTSGQG